MNSSRSILSRYDSLLVRLGGRRPLACIYSLLAASISSTYVPNVGLAAIPALQRLHGLVVLLLTCRKRLLGLDSTTMQRAAALQQQQGSLALIPRQPARSSGLLPASPLTVLSCQRRRRLSHHGLITPAAAAWPLQPRCAPSSRGPVACRASSSQPSSSADSNPSSSSSNADPTAAAAAALSSSQQEPPATAATPSSLTVEAVQTDPAATIDAIQRLTSPSQGDPTPAAAASESAAAAGSATTVDQQQQTEQQQQQGAFESFLAAVAAAWAGAQVHWQTLVGFCAAALAAVKASLAKFPAWVAAQKLQKLQEAADGTPTDAGKQAAYLAALNSNAHPR